MAARAFVLAGPVYETVRVLPLIKKQDLAIDVLMAALMHREQALERAGLMKSEELFVPRKAGFVWDVVTAGRETIERIERGCGVCA